jgi:hypothetical protein
MLDDEMKIPGGPGMEESNCRRQERSLQDHIYDERVDPSLLSYFIALVSLAGSLMEQKYLSPASDRAVRPLLSSGRAPLCIGS